MCLAREVNGNKEIQCFQVSGQSLSSSFLLLIRSGMSWQVFVGSHFVSINNAIFNTYPKTILPGVLKRLMEYISKVSLYHGNFELEFIVLRLLLCMWGVSND